MRKREKTTPRKRKKIKAGLGDIMGGGEMKKQPRLLPLGFAGIHRERDVGTHVQE